jgi:hypothetical protein
MERKFFLYFFYLGGHWAGQVNASFTESSVMYTVDKFEPIFSSSDSKCELKAVLGSDPNILRHSSQIRPF